MMPFPLVATLLWIWLGVSSAVAQSGPVRAVEDSLKSDSIDSLALPAPALPITNPVQPYRLLSFDDTVVARLVRPSALKKDLLKASFYHNTADAYKFVPGLLRLEYTESPLRTSLRPFGLRGDRLSVRSAGMHLHPFEHLPLANGALDGNDIPYARDYERYFIPGSLGQMVGATGAIGTIYARPFDPPDNNPYTRLKVQRGGLGYSNIAGRIDTRLADDRGISLGIEYRSGDGLYINSRDESYAYTGELLEPISNRLAIGLRGMVYNRDGKFPIAAEQPLGPTVNRSRFDRQAELTLYRQSLDRRVLWRGTVAFEGHGSSLASFYPSRFDLRTVGGTIGLLRRSGEWMLDCALRADHQEWDDNKSLKKRETISSRIRTTGSIVGLNVGAAAGVQNSSDQELSPEVSLHLSTRGSVRWYLSTGLTEDIPTLHELHLRRRTVALNIDGFASYRDFGNESLKREYQYSVISGMEWQSPTSRLDLSVGYIAILDGIEWGRSSATDSGGTTLVYSPVNRNSRQYVATLAASHTAWDALTLFGGGTVILPSETLDGKRVSPGYRPDGELSPYLGGELHLAIPQARADLYALAELLPLGRSDEDIEADPNGLTADIAFEFPQVLNLKFTLELRHFRLYYVIENLLGDVYSSREYISHFGQSAFFGFTWDFTD